MKDNAIDTTKLKDKYIFLKAMLIIVILSADLGKTTGIANISFHFAIFFSGMLLLFVRGGKLTYLKSEIPIYLGILIIGIFIIIYAVEINNIIHTVKLILIFFIIYPLIRSLFSAKQIINFLKTTLVLNIFLISCGLLGIEAAAKLTGYLRGSTLLNYAGSLYKVGLILLPYLIWDLINYKGKILTNLILLIMSIYVILFDGSRTGIICMMLIFCFYATLLMIRFIRTLKLSYKSLFGNLFLILAVGMICSKFKENIIQSNAYVRIAKTASLLLTHNMYDFLIYADSIRGYMILDAIATIKDNYVFLGNGFQTTMTNGIVIHNAYLQIFADLGLMPALCLLLIIFQPIIIGFKKVRNESSGFIIPSLMLLIVFSLTLMFHPFSVQVSDWALYIIPLSLVASHFKEKKLN